jgi:hypothetical protein
MTHRPHLQDETIEMLDEKVGDVMRIEPDGVSVDKKIRVLVEEAETNKELEKLEEIEEAMEGYHANLENEISNVNREVRNLDDRY